MPRDDPFRNFFFVSDLIHFGATSLFGQVRANLDLLQLTARERETA